MLKSLRNFANWSNLISGPVLVVSPLLLPSTMVSIRNGTVLIICYGSTVSSLVRLTENTESGISLG